MMGSLDRDSFSMLHSSSKRLSKGKKGHVTLPSHLVPLVSWEPLPPSSAGMLPAARDGHSLVVTSRVADGEMHPTELLYVIGVCGRGSLVELKDESPRAQLLKECAPHRLPARSQTLGLMAKRATAPAAPRARSESPARQSPQQSIQGVPAFSMVAAVKDGLKHEAEWEVVCTDLPRKLCGCTACSLGDGLRIVVFGGLDIGSNPVKATSELWLYDVTSKSWRDETDVAGGPPPCFEHAAAVGDAGREMFVHGGRGSTDVGSPPFSSMHRLEVFHNFVQWQQVVLDDEQLLGPLEGIGTLINAPPRRAHTLCLDCGGRARAYVFGGYGADFEVTSELHVLDTELRIWLQVEAVGDMPLRRAYHTATVIGPYMAVFGGVDANGALLKDLRLLHLPTLIWTLSVSVGIPGAVHGSLEHQPTSEQGGMAGMVSREPAPRAAHAAAVVSTGVRRGEYVMIVFGGLGLGRTTLCDAHRMVLSPSLECTGHCFGEYQGIDYVMGELQKAICRVQEEHEEQLQAAYARKKARQQEVRKIHTEALGARAKVLELEATSEEARMHERALRNTMVKEESFHKQNMLEVKARVRDLEIEISSLQAKVQRVRGEQSADLEELESTKDLEFGEGKHPCAVATLPVPNACSPNGKVERHNVSWGGAYATAETLWYPAGSPQLEAWEKAARCELRIISLLSHPNLQEVYGAAADSRGVFLLVEPFLTTLATHLGLLPACDNGSSKSSFEECEKLYLSCDLANGLDYLHSKGVAHRHVVAENAFVIQHVGVSAKLGGHFAANVTCRATGQPLVPRPGSCSVGAASSCVRQGSVDVRPADVRSLGILLLQIWLHGVASAAVAPATLAGTLSWPEAVAKPAEEFDDESAQGIRDESVRFVVGRSLIVDPNCRLSARVLHRALCRIQDGDVSEIPEIEDDPTIQSTLAAIALDEYGG